ncbi:hypothetical protein Tco_0451811 [Tanacetum coccineum]
MGLNEFKFSDGTLTRSHGKSWTYWFKDFHCTEYNKAWSPRKWVRVDIEKKQKTFSSQQSRKVLQIRRNLSKSKKALLEVRNRDIDYRLIHTEHVMTACGLFLSGIDPRVPT